MNAIDRHALAERLLEFMRHVSAHSGTSALGLADEVGLTPGALRTLLLLSNEPAPVSVSEIAERLQASQPTASRLVGALSRRGLADVEAAPDDRRARRVELSEAGLELLERFRAARVADLGRFVDDLPAAQAARLADALGALELVESA